MEFSVTQAAYTKIKQLLTSEKDGTFFRVNITGGGCSGFQYHFIMDDTLTCDDKELKQDNVCVVIDDMSLNLVQGGMLDYSQTMTASKFVIVNPNATAKCGCGNSFSI